MSFLLDTDICSFRIAATAVFYDLTLVTHNAQDFLNIPNLRMADWLVP